MAHISLREAVEAAREACHGSWLPCDKVHPEPEPEKES